jgi:hypothetical protein
MYLKTLKIKKMCLKILKHNNITKIDSIDIKASKIYHRHEKSQ